MAGRAPAFQFYAADFLADEHVAAMDNRAVGVYVKLLCYCWREGSVPSDLRTLGRMCGETSATMRRMWSVIEPCFRPAPSAPGRLVHSRLDVEREKQARFREQQAKLGRRGAAARWHGERHGQPYGDGHAELIRWPMATDGSSSSSSSSPSGDSVLRTGAAPRNDAQPHEDGWNARAAEHLRNVCYRPHGDPPQGFDIARDLKWWKSRLDGGDSEARIVAAINGVLHLRPHLKGQPWSPARVFSKVQDGVDLFERSVTEDGKHSRPRSIQELLASRAGDGVPSAVAERR